MKTITVDDIITWLRSLPPDAVVYQDEGSADYCVVATYGRTVLGIPELIMGYDGIYPGGGAMVPLDDALVPLIEAWDSASWDGLTANVALQVVEDLI